MAFLPTSSFIIPNALKQAPFLHPSQASVRSHYEQTGARFLRSTNSGAEKNAAAIIIHKQRMQCLPATTSTPQGQPPNNNLSRPFVDYPPDIWAEYLSSISICEKKLQSYSEEVEVLKERVGSMFLNLANDEDSNPMETIKFIYVLSRLGLSYHFEDLIEEQLCKIFNQSRLLPDLLSENDTASHYYDLRSTAIAFLTFRAHGYRIPPDVFNKFKDDRDGEFKKSLLHGDVRGLLSLYEATFLNLHGEAILEEAREFSKAGLIQILAADENGQKSINSHLRSQVADALNLPAYRSVQRWEARKYIDSYENDEESAPNQTLLRFAKVDFNRLQLINQQELSQLSEWWNKLNLVADIPYGRRRLMEIYIWSACNCDPCDASARIILFKISMCLLYVDDTYDSYSTHEERIAFTEAIQRWDYDSIDKVPNYLRNLYKAFLDTFREFDNEAITQGRSFSVAYAKQAVQDQVKGYHLESEWVKDGSVLVPSFEEYLDGPTSVTSTIMVIGAGRFTGMGEIAGVKEFEWLMSRPRLYKAAARIVRIRDDIVDHEGQKERDVIHIASSVDCYMKEYGVSEEEAVRELKKICEDEWMVMNEEIMRPHHQVPMKILQAIVFMTRLAEVTYQGDKDAFTQPQGFKEFVTKLYVDEIPIQD